MEQQVGMALSPNEGLKQHKYKEHWDTPDVGMALSPNEGLKHFYIEYAKEDIRVGMALSPNEGLKPALDRRDIDRFVRRNGAKPE